MVDMWIKKKLYENGQDKKGIIGSTLKPETLKVWSLSLHICSRMERDLREMSIANWVDTDEQHKDEKRGRINADANDKASIQRKLTEFIDPLDPSKPPPSLVNIVTETIAPTSANVDEAIHIGNTQMMETRNRGRLTRNRGRYTTRNRGRYTPRNSGRSTRNRGIYTTRTWVCKPDTGGGKPDTGEGKPDTVVCKPNTGVGKPDTGVAKPDKGVGKPETGVGKPETGVGQPETGVGQPETVVKPKQIW
jgi:hypothetical protein